MPEAIVLPGIDTPAPAPASTGDAAPAAPADGGSAPPSGDDSTQSASVDTGSGEPTDPTGEPAPTEPTHSERTQRGLQRRMGELVERERVQQQRGDRLEGLLAQVVQGLITPQAARAQAGAPSAADDPRPNDRDPQWASWQDYNSALMRWEARQEVRSQFEAATKRQMEARDQYERGMAEQAQVHAKHQLNSFLGGEMQAAAARIPGYAEQMMASTWDVPTNVQAAIALSGSVGEVTLYLSHHPNVVRQLAGLPDMAIATHVMRIANAMRSSSTNVSNAPAPGRPGGTRGSAPLDYPKDATPQQHLEWEARQRKAAGAARR